MLCRLDKKTTPTLKGNYTNFASFLYEIGAEYADDASFWREIEV
jgi:hypothetical protein